MTKNFLFALCGAILLPSATFAALPPQHQRLRELNAVLAKVGAELRDPITSIEFVSPDLYRVRSQKCAVEARIVPAKPKVRATPWMGPRRFVVQTGDPVCS